ncbi:hypothetical protein [Mycoplasma suis]|uniref:Uncharacterized protein n=1 Tax=Mycoplasma suis (strain Illinois) TaxID=768700 RepID=F0QQK3_MYCSL|nr:hypothetical protein [Mycoplasma suis]ADX97773.1 hypothetical protein MSU_0229 [Mycoplasma suis str. Illinois]
MADLFLTKKLIFSIFGVTGIFGVGGYGAINYLGKEHKVDTSTYAWYKEHTKDVQGVTFAEYISKDHQDENKSVCGEWRDSKSKILSPEECKKKVQGKWNGQDKKQPVVWFNADKNSIQKALESHFSNDYSNVELKELEGNKGWDTGGLKCIKVENSSVNTEEHVEVNCVEKEDTSNWVSN